MSDFERSLDKVLIHEGGFSNHPKDPGGATMKGVTQRVYDSYRKARGKPVQTVKAITAQEIADLYRARYWDVIGGDQLPTGLNYVVFDGAVNSGATRSVKWLQRALADGGYYRGPIDGQLGEGTLMGVAEHPDIDKLIASICKLRMAFLKALKTWSSFGRGWTSRVNGVLLTGQAWATGSVGPATHFVDGGNAKALETDVKKAPPKAPGDVAAGGGTITAALTQAREQLEPLSAIGNVSTILTYIAVAGLVVAVGGIAYRMWAKRRADKLKEALA